MNLKERVDEFKFQHKDIIDAVKTIICIICIVIIVWFLGFFKDQVTKLLKGNDDLAGWLLFLFFGVIMIIISITLNRRGRKRRKK